MVTLSEALLQGKNNIKVHWPTVIVLLSFSLNPFVIGFGKAINLSGIIPFTLVITPLSLLFFYLNFIVFECCVFSKSVSYIELFNCYFNNLDKLFNILVLLYGILYICLLEITIMITVISNYRDLTSYESEINPLVLFTILFFINSLIIVLSWSQNFILYYRACKVSLAMWALFLLGALFLVFTNLSDVSLLLSCSNYLYSAEFHHSLYIIVVCLNTFQSIVLIYKNYKEDTFNHPNSYKQSLIIAFIITFFSYIAIAGILSFTERITSKRSDDFTFDFMTVPMQIYRIFKYIWLILQVCLIVPTMKSSFLSIIYDKNHQISSSVSLTLSICFLVISLLCSIVVYFNQADEKYYMRKGTVSCYTNTAEGAARYEDDPLPYLDLNLKYYLYHHFYIATGLLSIVVGLIIPWILMIKSRGYNTFFIVVVGVSILVVLLCVVNTASIPLGEYIFPI